MTDQAALQITACNKVYANGFQALNDITLSVKQGSFLALLGPNGAGKSTIINCITNLIDGFTGSIEVFGHSLTSEQSKAKTLIGCVPQELNLNRFETTYNTLINNAGYYGIHKEKAHERALELLETLQLLDKKDTPTGMLSGGMKRRAMIARALMHNPPLLILDEPTAGVDVETRQTTWKLLRSLNQAGMTIILTTHHLDEAESLCDDIAILNHGKVIYSNKMNTLLHSHQQNTFICQSSNKLPSTFTLSCSHKKLNSNSFEIDLKSSSELSNIMQQLNKQSIDIKDIHTPSSKLEAIYIELVQKDKSEL